MTDNFPEFAQLVAKDIQSILEADEVFVVNVEGDALNEAYLKAFPPGTNPIFKERTEHDCSCCKGVIKHVGNIITVNDDESWSTIYDSSVEKAPPPYNEVASVLRDMVLKGNIVNVFRVSKKEGAFGAKETTSLDEETKRALTWNHFFTGPIPEKLRVEQPDTVRGDIRTTVEVFERALTDLTPDSVQTVLDLIAENTLYRGEQNKEVLQDLQKAQKEFNTPMAAEDRQSFLWTSTKRLSAKLRIRNTAIGQLLQALSKGEDLEEAVDAYGKMVDPANYRRSTSIITPRMVQDAMKTLKELDLEHALDRRGAVIEDISVRDVLWADPDVKSHMKGGLADVLMQHAVKSNPKSSDKEAERAEPISIDAFVKDVLPTATGMEVFFKGEHLSKLMTLTAPVHPEPKQLFVWNNDFAWSYAGDLADSEMRKAVQSRGGRVDGVFRFTHQWNYDKRNASLMDLHVFMPGSGIKYSEPGVHNDNYGRSPRVGWNSRRDLSSGGVQDVDYTHAAPVGYVPVENITFPDIKRMPEGDYVCKVHNWQLRTPNEGGFKAEIEFGGQIFEYEYDKPLKNKEWVSVATVNLKNGVFTITHHLPCGTSSREKWGIHTEQYVKVRAVSLSPNYWGDNAVGNKHTFFVLEGAKPDEPMRGMYNEFLHPRLQKHRKVFEIIGAKKKCPPLDGQLSGLGFSSTLPASIIVRVQQGKKRRLFNVLVGGAPDKGASKSTISAVGA